jgi:hypothetical protein
VSFETLTSAQLLCALDDPEWREAPVTDDISPCTVVEVSDDAVPEIPSATPRVFVASARPGGSAAGYDLVVDTDEDLERVCTACRTNPDAAVALVQLLRTTEHASLADALVAESFVYSTLLAGPEFGRWKTAQTSRDRDLKSEPSVPVLLDCTRDGLTIILNRPAVHNAYNAEMRDALIDALRAACSIGDETRVVLRGEGPSFCSGGDLAQFGTAPDPVRAHEIRTSRSPGLLLHALRQRATAIVHGSCIGAGVELPAFCGRVEAAPGTTFRLPEIEMGLIPGAGGTASLPRRIGRQATARLAITGATLDAATAMRLGLVDALVDV